MIGHPTETDDDIQGIVDLTLKARHDLPAQHRDQRHALRAQGAHAVPVDGDDAGQDAGRPAALLKRALAKHGVDGQTPTRRNGPRCRRCWRAATAAWRPCCSTCRRAHRCRGFHEALARHGLSAAELPGRARRRPFQPWDIVESGVKPSFLRYEQRLAGREAQPAIAARRARWSAWRAGCAASQARID